MEEPLSLMIGWRLGAVKKPLLVMDEPPCLLRLVVLAGAVVIESSGSFSVSSMCFVIPRPSSCSGYRTDNGAEPRKKDEEADTCAGYTQLVTDSSRGGVV